MVNAKHKRLVPGIALRCCPEQVGPTSHSCNPSVSCKINPADIYTELYSSKGKDEDAGRVPA